MKHIPSAVKEKYDILGVIGEGRIFTIIFINYTSLETGSYGVVLKARKKVFFQIDLNQHTRLVFFSG
jgi:hypothetical protein